MPSFTSFVSFLALGSAAVSAMNLSPALPIAGGMRLGKRDVQCGGGVFCPDGNTCEMGSNNVMGCCPVGETCSGPGGIETVIATLTTSVETTQFSTFIHHTTGFHTDIPEPTTTPITTTYESAHTSTETETETGTETETETGTETTECVSETETTYYTTATGDYSTTTYEPVPTTLYPTTIKSNATRTGNGTSATGTPKAQEGGAAGVLVVNVGISGLVAAVLAAVMV